MKGFRVVADSSCLIGLAEVNLFTLLKELFSEVYISNAVYDEVVIDGKGQAGANETDFAVQEGWILKESANDELVLNSLTTILGRGEAEVIILCKQLNLDYALIDERIARDTAEILNVNTMGVLGIIDLAVHRGFPINKKKVVDKLIDVGFRISEKLYKKMFPNS